jgi:hypothetical protein
VGGSKRVILVCAFNLSPARADGEALLPGGEGVGEERRRKWRFVHGGVGGGRRSSDWWSGLLCSVTSCIRRAGRMGKACTAASVKMAGA